MGRASSRAGLDHNTLTRSPRIVANGISFRTVRSVVNKPTRAQQLCACSLSLRRSGPTFTCRWRFQSRPMSIAPWSDASNSSHRNNRRGWLKSDSSRKSKSSGGAGLLATNFYALVLKDQNACAQMTAGTKPMADYIAVPKSYQMYLDSGRFRNALILDGEKRHSTPGLTNFIFTYGLRAYKPVESPADLK